MIRVIQESLAAIEIDEGLRDRQRDDQLHPHRDGAAPAPPTTTRSRRAQELGYAEADPTDDVERRRRRGEDGDPRPARLRHAGRRSTTSPTRGSSEIQPDDIAYAKELGLSLKLLGVAERRDDGISVRVFPCFLYRGHPLAPVEGPFNAVMVEAPAITEITMSGPGAGGIETASAVLGDVVSILSGEAPVHDAARARCAIVARRQLVLLPPPRGRRPARRARPDRRGARRQRGLGPQRRPAGASATTRAW